MDWDIYDVRLPEHLEELAYGQLSFKFGAQEDHSQKTSEQLAAEVIAYANTLKDKLASDYEAMGLRIFDVNTETDELLVPTDFGAPIHGLDFYKQLQDQTRSYRYAPVKRKDGYYKTHFDQATVVAKHFAGEGYKLFEHAQDQHPYFIHFSNGGVTRLFSDITGFVVKQHRAVMETRKQFGQDRKGVILLPVPTYGLFMHKLQLLEDDDIKIRYVRRHDNGAVDQHSLRMAIEECRLNDERVILYYDCNSNNPTGYIREEQETRDIHALLLEEEERFFNTHIDWLKSRIETLPKPYIDGLMRHIYKPECGIIIIDDMAYEGLDLNSGKKPFSFGQIDLMAAQRVAVLKGLSKIGLPGARIGLVIAHAGLTDVLAYNQLIDEFAASTQGVDMITARFSDHPLRQKFHAHEDKLRDGHNHHAGIIEAFVHGLDDTKRLSAGQKEDLVWDYAAHASIDVAESRTRLMQGLPNFHVMRNLESGFFMRLGCENLFGKPVIVRIDDEKTPYARRLYESQMLYWIFRHFGIDGIRAEAQGASRFSLQMRITSSIQKSDLYTLFDRLRTMHDYFFGDKPQVQLDLLRQNSKAATRGLTPG